VARGTRRLPRAVRAQQMLDAAVEVFSRNGFHDSSMDEIAEAAAISKPMLYLYHGSKDELFQACIMRETQRFVQAVTEGADPDLSPREQLARGLLAFFTFVAEHRDSWLVLYRQARGQQPFAAQVVTGRVQVAQVVSALLQRSNPHELPADHFDAVAFALVGAGEALADRMLDQPEVDPQATAALLVELAWHGLAGARDRAERRR